MLEWFNDGHCKKNVITKSFTYICKSCCNTFLGIVSCVNFDNHSCINMLLLQQLREIKMDDIYIHNMYTLFLLFDMSQIKQRRGQLCFQQEEDDEDITTMDTTKTTIKSSIFDQEMKSIQNGIIVSFTRSYFTSLLAQEKIEIKSLTSWTQIRTAEIYPTSNSNNIYIRNPNWVIHFASESISRVLSNPIGFTFKFLWSE